MFRTYSCGVHATLLSRSGDDGDDFVDVHQQSRPAQREAGGQSTGRMRQSLQTWNKVTTSGNPLLKQGRIPAEVPNLPSPYCYGDIRVRSLLRRQGRWK